MVSSWRISDSRILANVSDSVSASTPALLLTQTLMLEVQTSEKIMHGESRQIVKNQPTDFAKTGMILALSARNRMKFVILGCRLFERKIKWIITACLGKLPVQ